MNPSLSQVDRVQRIAAFRRSQPMDELERKARKSLRRQRRWTQEELDLGVRRAEKVAAWLRIE